MFMFARTYETHKLTHRPRISGGIVLPVRVHKWGMEIGAYKDLGDTEKA